MSRLMPLVISCALLSGCLSNAHKIPRGELFRLAETPPAERGKRVRVIQEFSTSEGPPAAPGVSGSTGVYVGVGVSAPAVRVVPRRSNQAALHAQDSKFWRILAVAAALGLAVTEGARYDGWVELHPMHPVHLYFPDGYTWVPLAHLTPEVAAGATKAYVRSSEGPWQKRGRAPLNRVGFTYAVLGGVGVIPASGGDAHSGVSSHLQLGGFPVQSFGILVDLHAAWASDDQDNTLFDSRTSLELDVYPVDLGIFHLGLFAQGGIATRLDDGPGSDRSELFLGTGPLAQLELTTRLAITARVGFARVYDATISDATIGLSIY